MKVPASELARGVDGVGKKRSLAGFIFRIVSLPPGTVRTEYCKIESTSKLVVEEKIVLRISPQRGMDDNFRSGFYHLLSPTI